MIEKKVIDKTFRMLLSLLALLLISINASGQFFIPDFKSNLNYNDSADLKKFMNTTLQNYDIAISLNFSSPWDTTVNMILYHKEGKWMQLKVFSDNPFDNNVYNTIKKDTIQQFYDLAWQGLINNHLFSINSDSLNIRERKLADSTMEYFNVADGIVYGFCIVTKNKQRYFSIPEPETFLGWMPKNIDIEDFITCKNIFLSLWGYEVNNKNDKIRKNK
ncbi:MAG: hypothetical protein WCQ95_12960 [Bacteroidota bacterium]